ncbi:MAG: hypothetical protein ACN4GZ_13425 [Acidimicrobiales bacterium]
MPRSKHLLQLLGALTLLLAACGGSGGDTTTPALPTLTDEPTATVEVTTTTEAVDPEEAFQDYTACMQEHGIEMPDPSSAGGGLVAIEGDVGLDIEAFEDAAEKCDPILEAAFGEFEMSPEQEAEMMDQELALAQCMRDNGIDWPDPSGGGNLTIELGDDVDPETLNAAMETCMKDAFGDLGGVIGGGATP